MTNDSNSRKLFGEICLFVFLVLSVLAINYRMADQFVQDATSINLVGRQRMLTQRITKVVLQLQQQSPLEDRHAIEQEFREAVRLFDQTLFSLEQGGMVEGGDGRLIRLRKIEDGQAIVLLNQAVQTWRPMRERVMPLIAGDTAIPPGVIGLTAELMQESNLRLLDLMNRLTSSLEGSRANVFWWFQAIVFLTAMGVFALIVRNLQRTASTAIEESQHFEGLATRDPLTELFNRREFENALEREFASIQRRGGGLALLLVDLDGFKAVNDTHGHDAGDKVLLAVAARLSEHARTNDTVARLGGDEFVLICPGMTDKDDAAALSGRLIEAIGLPVEIEGLKVQVGASIGIAFSGDSVEGCGNLIRLADHAMYAAKQAGRNRYVFAQPG